MIDYGIIDKRIAHLVGKEPVEMDEFPATPHLPTSYSLQAVAGQRWERVLVKPQPLPLTVPIGCAPRPPDWPTEVSPSTAEESDEMWATLVRNIEKEVFDRQGWTPEESKPFMGRASPPTYRVQAVAGKGRADEPRLNQRARAHRWTRDAVSYIEEVCRKQRPNKEQPAQIARKGRAAKLMTKHMNEEKAEQWDEVFAWLAGGAARSCDLEALRALAAQWRQEAAAQFDEIAKEMQQQWRQAWRDKLDKALAGSGPSLFQMIKEVLLWRPRPSKDKLGDAASPTEAAERARETWAEEWRVQGEAGRERPWESFAPSGAEQLEDITGDMVKAAARKFKNKTGVGSDRLHPKVLLQLSQPGLEAIGAYLTQIERAQRHGRVTREA